MAVKKTTTRTPAKKPAANGAAKTNGGAPKKAAASDLRERVRLDIADSFDEELELELDDGRVLDSGDIRFARGNAKLILSEQEMRTKFMDCTQRQADMDREALWGHLSNLAQVPTARALAAT